MGDGSVFKNAMRSIRLTQQEVADKLRVSRATINLLYAKERLTEDWKLKIIQTFQLSNNVFTGKNYAENDDVVPQVSEPHLLNADERKALWDIINAQKAIIQRLEQSIQENESDK